MGTACKLLMKKLVIGLFNDSFPPTIDGVANTVLNYAKIIQSQYGEAVVATPSYPAVVDDYPFAVIRYPSVSLGKKIKYRAGLPFSPLVIEALRRKKIDLIHTHSPFISTMLARALRFYTGAPIVLTYHTKFEIDLDKFVPFNSVKQAIVKMILTNVHACDEVWAVSDGTGQNLKHLGYKGEYVVMQNGTDYALGKSPAAEIDRLRTRHSLAADRPVFLYVGRMMWYKGIRFTLDALQRVRREGQPFTMIFIGEGTDRPAIMDYARELGLADDCIFTGAIYDRAEIKAYFSLADLFILTSTYDNSPLVVREAAACHCASLLIAGSCSAEVVADQVSGILAEENKDAIAEQILAACAAPGRLQELGDAAAQMVYMSWDDAVAKAYARYQTVLENHRYKDVKWRADKQLVRHLYRRWHRNTVLFQQKTNQRLRRTGQRLKKTGQRIKGSFQDFYRQ